MSKRPKNTCILTAVDSDGTSSSALRGFEPCVSSLHLGGALPIMDYTGVGMSRVEV